MLRNTCALTASAVIVLLMMSTAYVRADTLGTYGDETVVGGSFQLTSSLTVGTQVGYAGLYDTVSGPLTPATLTQLSTDYHMTIGTFGGGAPRFSLADTTNNNNNEAYIYFGTPLGGESFSDPATGSTGNYADLFSTDVRVYNNGFGGVSAPNTGLTWSQFVASVGTVPIKYVFLDLDGYFSQPGGTQQMLVSNFTVNGNVFNPTAAVPLPKAAYAGLGLLAGLALLGGLKRRQRRLA